MAVIRKRKIIGSVEDGICLTVLTDKKYATTNFIVHFIAPITEENAPLNAIVPYMLESSCKDYPTLTALKRRLAALYGANIRGGITRFAGSHDILMSACSIADKYALDGEEISIGLLELFCGCIFEPVCENNAFDEKDFALKKQELIDDIEADINNKRGYAIKRAGKIIYENEPRSISVKGECETAKKITAAEAYEAYKKLIKSARIEIYMICPEESEKCEKLIEKKFSQIKRENVYMLPVVPSLLKPEPRYVTERLDIVQSKMVMAYKTPIKADYALMVVFNNIYGAMPTSMLFKNVREKMSLCYYCSSSYAPKTQVLCIDSGVENNNIENAEKEIQNQLDLCAKGEFSDELFEQAKLSVICRLKGADDNARGIADWYYGDFLEKEENIFTPEQMIEKIKNIKREQVSDFAASFKLDTVYVLTGKEE